MSTDLPELGESGQVMAVAATNSTRVARCLLAIEIEGVQPTTTVVANRHVSHRFRMRGTWLCGALRSPIARSDRRAARHAPGRGCSSAAPRPGRVRDRGRCPLHVSVRSNSLQKPRIRGFRVSGISTDRHRVARPLRVPTPICSGAHGVPSFESDECSSAGSTTDDRQNDGGPRRRVLSVLSGRKGHAADTGR